MIGVVIGIRKRRFEVSNLYQADLRYGTDVLLD